MKPFHSVRPEYRVSKITVLINPNSEIDPDRINSPTLTPMPNPDSRAELSLG